MPRNLENRMLNEATRLDRTVGNARPLVQQAKPQTKGQTETLVSALRRRKAPKKASFYGV